MTAVLTHAGRFQTNRAVSDTEPQDGDKQKLLSEGRELVLLAMYRLQFSRDAMEINAIIEENIITILKNIHKVLTHFGCSVQRNKIQIFTSVKIPNLISLPKSLISKEVLRS
jgi:uncharacterized membrane protein YhfC